GLHPPSDLHITNETVKTWCDWDPFESNSVLGFMDSCFLFSYAIFMFGSGFVAERCHLRYFLALGMIGSGVFTYLFGVAYYYDIHNIYYFVIVQILCGMFQTTGWPAVVAAVGHWFGPHSSRGFIFGIWNSHTSAGNILGAYVAGAFVEYNWGLSFIVPGVIIAATGFLIFLFLVPYPEEVGLQSHDSDLASKVLDVSFSLFYQFCLSKENIASFLLKNRFCVSLKQETDNSSSFNGDSIDSGGNYRRRLNKIQEICNRDEEAPLIDEVSYESANKGAVSFLFALKIPGVIEFSLSLFFSKLVCYTFLYWLPKYIKVSTSLSAEDSAYLSIPFDLGGIVGSVLAGLVADKTGASGLTCIVMLLLSIPSLFVYQLYGTLSLGSNIFLLSVLGALVNGPYCLITTAVAADLGNLVTDSQAMATVTAIIDGTGSIGAAIGPLLAGFVSNSGNWNNVFYMVIFSTILSFVFLLRIGRNEMRKFRVVP
ncbi:Sugar phosphate exchanger 2-like protein, partial [Dinothrombium tinctorium]